MTSLYISFSSDIYKVLRYSFLYLRFALFQINEALSIQTINLFPTPPTKLLKGGVLRWGFYNLLTLHREKNEKKNYNNNENIEVFSSSFWKSGGRRTAEPHRTRALCSSPTSFAGIKTKRRLCSRLKCLGGRGVS